MLTLRRYIESHQQRGGLISQSYCSRAQGYNDNSGLGPILAQYLKQSAQGHILVLIMNKLGNDQMITYFRSDDNDGDYGGMICEREDFFLANESAKKMFDTIKEIHQKSYQEHGGEYFPRDNHERTCAVRLPPNRFFEVP